MSLSNEQNFEKYSPSVPTTEFEWGIYYFADTDIAVSVEDSEGVITALVLNASTDGFSVAATNGDKRLGATITTTETYDTGDNITISREVPYTQEYDLKAGQSINNTNLNKAFDRTVAQSQQLNEQIDRQLEHPITDPEGLSYEAPAVVDRASKAVGWDASGNVTALSLVSSGTVAVDDSKGLDITGNIISSKVDDVTIGFDGNGKHEVKDGGIDTDQLATDAVTEAKIEANAVTTDKIADANVTFAKPDFIIDDDTMGTATDTNVPTSESVKAYVDASDTDGFDPTAYAGGESAKLPNGLIIKMGQYNSVAGSKTVTFGTAFPNACVAAQAAILNTTITANQTVTEEMNAAYVKFYAPSGTFDYTWFAIGY